MSGFFSKDEIVGINRGASGKTIGCASCGLYRSCKSPKMKPHGEGKKEILIWAEAPGEKEDKLGKQLVGKPGLYLRRLLKRNKIDIDRDCIKINSVNCHPPDSRNPKPKEIQACRNRILKVIKKYKPKAIFLLGNIAIDSCFGHRVSVGTGIYSWRGWQIPDQDHKCWIFPMYHPAYVKKAAHGNQVIETIFEMDLKNAIDHYQDDFPEWKDPESCIEILTSPKQILPKLEEINRGFINPIAFDYETTGLRPIAKGHHIVTLSIATDRDNAFAFPFDDINVERIWGRILKNPNIKKIAHHMKFEDMWTRHIMNIIPEGWLWDTMYGSHTLDNRRGCNDLEFQSIVNFGIMDFKDATGEFLKGTEKHANSFNRIYEANMKDVLKRNALDSLLEYRLAEVQWEKRKKLGIDICK